MRASLNARKHGLSTSIRKNPKISSVIEALAVAIAGSNPNPRKLQAACELAEAYLELRRLQKFKLVLIRTDATRRLAARKRLGEIPNDNEQLTHNNVHAYIRTLPLLVGFERYESRAQSRQMRAFYAFSIACEKSPDNRCALLQATGKRGGGLQSAPFS